MSELEDYKIDSGSEPAGDGEPGRGVRWWPIVAVLVVLAIGIGAYLLWLRRQEADEPTAAAARPPAEAAEQAAEEAEAEEPLDLPELDASDELVRDLVGALSSRPALAEWLASDDLVRTFAVTVDNIAEGVSPRTHLKILRPSEAFRAVERNGRFYLDPASYSRYERLALVVESLDAEGTARLYRDLKPLIQEAYRDLGYPQRDFDRTLARAIDRLLATPVVEGEVELIRKVTTYDFADPRLEQLAPAQKHLVRMGPANARRVKAKLREIARVLELPLESEGR